MRPAELRVAIVYEDGAYGTDVAAANASTCEALGVQVIMKQSFRTGSSDLGPLIGALKAARPHVILHTAYYPDVVNFLEQAAELDLRFDALIGQGAGYAQIDQLIEAFDDDIDYR